MTRAARRVLASMMRKQATAWPAQLAEVPESEWPEAARGVKRPLAVWRSQYFLAVVYATPAVGGVEARRLSVNRVTITNDGHWGANIAWEDLQRCKTEAGYGDWYGVEVYPRERDVVNVANMRHLWLLAEPLPIGWFEGAEAV